MARPRIYRLNEDIFTNIDSEEKAYWFGFIFADGSISVSNTGQHFLQIKLKSTENLFLEKFTDFIDTDKPVSFGFSSNRFGDVEYCYVSISSKKIVEDLVSNGLQFRKSNIALFPNIKDSLVHHFIRGYIDGDGSFFPAKGGKRSKTYSLGFSILGTEQFLSVLNSYLPFSLPLYKEKRTEHTYYLSTAIGLDKAKVLFEFLYLDANIYMDRKINVFIEYFKQKTFNDYNHFAPCG
jgi:DNA-binding transcriptional regulator WhiA